MKVQLKNPAIDEKDSYRVYRGGLWGGTPLSLRASYRLNYAPPMLRIDIIGFRLVRNK